MSKDEKKKEAKTEASPEEEVVASKKKRLLIFGIGGAVLLAAIGGGIAFFLASGSGGAQASKPSDAEAHASKNGEDAKHQEPGHSNNGEPKEAKSTEKDAKEGAKQPEKTADKKDDGKADQKKEADSAEKKDGAPADPKAQAGSTAKSKSGAAGGADAKIDGIDFGCTHTFPTFNLNLGNPLENRFMRMEVAVEYGCGDVAKAELDRRAPQLRDAVTSVARRKTREFMLGPDGLDQLRKEIHIKLNSLLTNKIEKVFITDLLIE